MDDDDIKATALKALKRHPKMLFKPASRGASAHVTFLDRWVIRKFLDAVGELPYSVVLWNGEEVAPHHARARNRVTVKSRSAFYRALVSPNRYFGDDYCSGDIEIEGSLVEFFENVYQLEHLFQERAVIGWLFSWLDRPRAGTLTRSRDTIQYHYDVGNAFYQLWLDSEAMQYTCAYFPCPDLTLEQAQVAKMHHICRKLRIKEGEAVVDAGCGWGGLASFMARHYGVTVRAYNISHEQVKFARSRARAAGLQARVEYVEDDYRNIRGQYDAFVSIGMLEHVGPAHYHALGKVIDQCLKANGRGLIQTIGRNLPIRTTAWIGKRVLPGTYLPTIRELMATLEPFSFSVIDVENMRLHYAKTLAHWLGRFEDHEQEVRDLYDETFARAWRLYLASSVASFSTGWLQLYQVLFRRAHNNDIPWSRAYMYS
jgi:cyclopropane-fatty-acyl-phospholipid synthase